VAYNRGVGSASRLTRRSLIHMSESQCPLLLNKYKRTQLKNKNKNKKRTKGKRNAYVCVMDVIWIGLRSIWLWMGSHYKIDPSLSFGINVHFTSKTVGIIQTIRLIKKRLIQSNKSKKIILIDGVVNSTTDHRSRTLAKEG